mmetsp:Transcript_5799/g.22925  ORF Transcript_5799/g.22925 Transcript_5799/m.22925 type:complete len:224 (-) Transcript_5799:34-705(-)
MAVRARSLPHGQDHVHAGPCATSAGHPSCPLSRPARGGRRLGAVTAAVRGARSSRRRRPVAPPGAAGVLRGVAGLQFRLAAGRLLSAPAQQPAHRDLVSHARAPRLARRRQRVAPPRRGAARPRARPLVARDSLRAAAANVHRRNGCDRRRAVAQRGREHGLPGSRGRHCGVQRKPLSVRHRAAEISPIASRDLGGECCGDGRRRDGRRCLGRAGRRRRLGRG